MCGIIGYVGKKEAAPILLGGLERLEYRGYDSAGIGILNGGDVHLVKCQGSLQFLKEEMAQQTFCGTVGIGHTRWATHGIPSTVNSHPHMDADQQFIVVHNGIIENYMDLKKQLQRKGYPFLSDTDTEVIPHLLKEYYQGDLVETVKKVFGFLEGSYALGIISRAHPGMMIGVRQDSPLVVGVGVGENFLASDIPALLSHTRDFYLLENGELVLLTNEEIQIQKLKGGHISRRPIRVDWEEDTAQKDGHAHFMLKEIMEQPQAIRSTLRGLGGAQGQSGYLKEIALFQKMQDVDKIFITACGTAFYSALFGKNLLERLLDIPVEVDISSEFRYRKNLLDEKSLFLCVSQSGETADTLAAVREAKRKGCKTLGIINMVGSSIAREVDMALPLWVGPEVSVASTKAYLGMLMAFSFLSVTWAQAGHRIHEGEYQRLLSALQQIPQQAEEILQDVIPWIKGVVPRIKEAQSMFFIGRQLDYAVALEGALKMKEISYIHAECYAAGELKHGTLALVDEKTPVVALLTQPAVYKKTLSNIKEVKARGASVIAISSQRDPHLAETVDDLYYLPETQEELAPLLSVLPLQMLAYYTALERGCSIDQPRNLAKSVTVE